MPDKPPRALTAGEWERLFLGAGVLTEELGGAKSKHAKAILLGRFLAPLVGREFPVEIKGRTRQAVLRVVQGRANEKRYVFRILREQAASGPLTEVDPPPSRGEAEEGAQSGPTPLPCATPPDAPKPRTKGSSKKREGSRPTPGRTKREPQGKADRTRGTNGNEEVW